MNTYWQETLGNFLEDHAGDWDDQTQAWYKKRLEPFGRYLSGQDVKTEKLTIRHVKRFLGQAKRTYSVSTLNGIHTALGMFFRWLKEEGLIRRNIWAEAQLKRPKKSRRVKRTIPLRYIEQMIHEAEAAGTSVGIRDAAIMKLLIKTGVRREELVDLQLADVDLDEGYAIVRGKFDHERRIFLDAELVRSIQTWLIVRPKTAVANVFVTLHAGSKSAGQRMRPDNVNDRLILWRDQAGLPAVSVSPHKWRHTFASQYNENGGDPFSLQVLLGHTDIQTTKIYVHLPNKVLKKKALEHGPKLPGQHDT